MEFDNNGNLIYSTTLGNTISHEWVGFGDKIDESGYIIGGLSNKSGTYDAYLVRTDSLFNVIWDWYDDLGKFERTKSVHQDYDGGIILGCFSGYQDGAELDNLSDGDGYIVKLNAMGEEQWRVEFGTEDDDCDTWVIPYIAETDKYIVWGCDGVTSWITDPNEDKLFWIAKTDSTGTIYWRTEFPEMRQIIRQVRELDDGGFIVCGSDTDEPGWFPYYGWMARLNSFGYVLWERNYYYYSEALGVGTSQTTQNYFNDVTPTPDGGFLATGTHRMYNDSIHNLGARKTWLLKVDGNGCLEPDCTEEQIYVSVEDVVLPFEQPPTLQIYPNPAITQTQVYFSPIPPLQKASLQCYDLLGRQIAVFPLSVGQKQVSVDTNDWRLGVYFVVLEVDGRVVGKEKMVVLK